MRPGALASDFLAASLAVFHVCAHIYVLIYARCCILNCLWGQEYYWHVDLACDPIINLIALERARDVVNLVLVLKMHTIIYKYKEMQLRVLNSVA